MSLFLLFSNFFFNYLPAFSYCKIERKKVKVLK